MVIQKMGTDYGGSKVIEIGKANEDLDVVKLLVHLYELNSFEELLKEYRCINFL